jgi:CheY-like chemotaxis protein
MIAAVQRQVQPDVLIVEDDYAIRDALMQLLEDEGYAVAGAANGQEALDLLRRHLPPCLILLDLMMPVMTGWEFRAEQQRDPALATIPVVVVSADRHALTTAADMDAVAILVKPVPLRDVLAIVERYCR